MPLPLFFKNWLGRSQRSRQRIPSPVVVERPAWWSRVSIHDTTLLKTPLDETLGFMHHSGVLAIGLSRDKLSEIPLPDLLRELRTTSITVSSLGVVGGFTNYNGFTFQDAILDGLDAIELAEQLRAPVLRVISGPIAGHLRKHARRLVVDGLRELLPLARACGVRLALQPMSSVHREWSFLNSLEIAVGILEEIDSPSVGLAFGTSHLGTEKHLLKRLPEIVPWIATVQLSDWVSTTQDADRRLPGQGHLPLNEIVSVIEAHGYRGWYELEVWSRDLWKLDSETLMKKCLQSLSCLSPLVPTTVNIG